MLENSNSLSTITKIIKAKFNQISKQKSDSDAHMQKITKQNTTNRLNLEEKYQQLT